ncbi:MAG: pseudouridine synthase [Methyloligella sp. ZOD6]
MSKPDQDSKTAKLEIADGPMRVAKRIARAGLCSRRDAEKLIEEGRVAVNDKVLATPACVVSETDKVTVDGKPLPELETPRLWRYHKPKGLVTSHKDEQGRKTVFEALPPELPRVISVGRLDIATEGLLLLTTDGAIARHLELPSTGWLRRYRARAYGQVSDEQLEEIRAGVTIDGIAYGPVEAAIERVQGGNVWLSIGIREGKNREVKRLLEHLGLKVNRLIRVSFGPFQLGELAPGAVQEVGPKALTSHLGVKLAQELGLRAPTKQGGKRPTPGKYGKPHSQTRRRAKR